MQTHGVEQVEMGAEIRGMQLEAKECQALPTTSSDSEARTRGREQIFPLSLQKEPFLPTP